MQNLNKELKMAEIDRVKMETEKLRAETLKLQKETQWHPWLALIVASIALAASFVALLK
ncbi:MULTISPECIES: hypothetical protein [unclassified Acinetobacter]|uniref:hypothetical protein n=1 Tax=unclassified Acinetobacter TaxID=196816 RepID=UPI0035B8F21E